LYHERNGVDGAHCPPNRLRGGQVGAACLGRSRAQTRTRTEPLLFWLRVLTVMTLLVMMLPAKLFAQNEATQGKWDRLYYDAAIVATNVGQQGDE
jgi:hypothetical protein